MTGTLVTALVLIELLGFTGTKDPERFLRLVLGSEEDPRAFVGGAGSIHITDDRPFNEYYVLREIAGAR